MFFLFLDPVSFVLLFWGGFGVPQVPPRWSRGAKNTNSAAEREQNRENYFFKFLQLFGPPPVAFVRHFSHFGLHFGFF